METVGPAWRMASRLRKKASSRRKREWEESSEESEVSRVDFYSIVAAC